MPFQKTSISPTPHETTDGLEAITPALLRLAGPYQWPPTSHMCQRPPSVPSQKTSSKLGPHETAWGAPPSGPPPSPTGTPGPGAVGVVLAPWATLKFWVMAFQRSLLPES